MHYLRPAGLGHVQVQNTALADKLATVQIGARFNKNSEQSKV
jgi:hypothetical protein